MSTPRKGPRVLFHVQEGPTLPGVRVSYHCRRAHVRDDRKRIQSLARAFMSGSGVHTFSRSVIDGYKNKLNSMKLTQTLEVYDYIVVNNYYIMCFLQAGSQE